jgi:hypothetical protein
MEKAIQNHRNHLLKTGIDGHWDPDEDQETFWGKEKNIPEQNDYLNDKDLEYINGMLNSSSTQDCTHKNSTIPKFESITPEDVLARALASPRTPPEFNLKFNQKSTTRSSDENHFSYFSNIEEEGTTELGDYFSGKEEDTELGDYFSDDEEDDTGDIKDLTGESNPWNHTQFNHSEDFPHSQLTLSEWDPVISGLKTINEVSFEDDCEANQLNHISGLSEETKVAFSTWQPFIPQKHAYNLSAHYYWPDSSQQQASLSQEPTFTPISSITTESAIKPTPAPTTPFHSTREIRISPLQDWKPSRPATKPCTKSWSRSYPRSNRTYETTRTSRSESPNHLGQSKPFRRWRRPSPVSNKTIIHNTKLQTTPPETDAGNAHQVFIPYPSQNYSNMTFKKSTTVTKSLETKWRKYSNRIQNCQTKFQKPIKHLQKNSKRPRYGPCFQDGGHLYVR